MNRDQRIKARQQKIQGIDKRILQRAAQEIDAKGKLNARMVEVDAKTDWGTRTQDVYVIHERTSSGGWRAYSLEDICDQGTLDVSRPDRENLEPALRFQMAEKLVRGAVFNAPRDGLEYARDHVRFIVADTLTGKVH